MTAWYSPVNGAYRVTSNFLGGFRKTGGHSGIDFAVPTGTLIQNVVPGRVIFAGYQGAYGNLVIVQHADGSTGYYAHQSRIAVRPGQAVGRGSPLGYAGSTGNSTGPHLHFEVRQNGKPVNPTPWLQRSYNGNMVTSNQRMDPGYYAGVRLNTDQLRNAQTIISVGRSMGASERDIIVGLMTAMQESRLQNLSYGDRDSLGLFQQRPSAGWGSPGQVTNPTYAAGKFFESLLRLKGRDRMRLTEAAQAVQRSAFPEAYAQWENLARQVFGAPGAGAYAIPDYGNYHTSREIWRNPGEIFASFDMMEDESLTATPASPADSPVAEPAESIDDWQWGDFGMGEV